MADVNADVDNTDDVSATVDVLFREGTYGQNVNTPNALRLSVTNALLPSGT